MMQRVRLAPDPDWSLCACEWESNWWVAVASSLAAMARPSFPDELLDPASEARPAGTQTSDTV